MSFDWNKIKWAGQWHGWGCCFVVGRRRGGSRGCARASMILGVVAACWVRSYRVEWGRSLVVNKRCFGGRLVMGG